MGKSFRKKHQKAWGLSTIISNPLMKELQNSERLGMEQHKKLANVKNLMSIGSFQPQKIPSRFATTNESATHAIVSLIGGRIDSDDF